MSGATTVLVERLVAFLLPEADRDAVIGDIREEVAREDGTGAGLCMLKGLAIAVHVHAEPYRELGDRLILLTIVGASLALLWLVPMAAGPVFADPGIYPDPMSRIVLSLWTNPHIVSALAAGLLVGRLPGAPAHCAHAWLPLAMLLAAVAALAWQPGDGWLAAPALLCAARLGGWGRFPSGDEAADRTG